MNQRTCRRCAHILTPDEKGAQVRYGKLTFRFCDACAAQLPPKRQKYHARKTVVDGITFDSAREAQVYRDLKLREKAGELSFLELQPTFPIIVNDQAVATYRADFGYYENGTRVVVDVKGMKTPLYRLKRKLVEALYGFTITEVR